MCADLARELQYAGKAIGLLGPDGGLDPSWFSHADERLQTILSKDSQRSGVLDLLNQIAPPASIPGLASTEKWHPLLGPKPNGNLYLTVNSSGSAVVIGMAGELNGGFPGSASLRARLPLMQFSGNSLTAIAGKSTGPLDLIVRVPLGWTHSGTSIGLKAIRAEVHLAPLDGQFHLILMLEGLDLDGSGPHDVLLDSSNLGAEATHVVVGLIQQSLLSHAPSGIPEVQATINHLTGLFGVGSDGIPVFPFADLLKGPAPLQSWLNGLIGSGKVTAWLAHVAGLFGASIAVSGSGTAAAPWRIRIADLNVNSGLDVTLAVVSQKLLVGTQMALAGTSAGLPDARLQASASIVGIPLSGTGAASVLPSASLVVRTPNKGAALVSSAAISADAMRVGVSLDGTTVSPIVELLNVTLQGTHFDRIDLTNADSVTSAATDLVKAKLLAAIGGSPAANHLLALVGLAAPAGDASWPAVDLTKLCANPAQAIAAVHRAGFAAGHDWGVMLAEVAGLLSLAGSVTGAGTQASPWVVSLAPAMGPAALELAAWNAQTAPGGDPQLRIGLRLGATSGPWAAYWSAELLAFDLPSAGGGQVTLLGGQHLSFELEPVPSTPPYAGMTLAADSIGIYMDWVPGGPMKMFGQLKNIAVKEGAIEHTIATLRYPPSGAPPTDLPSLAASLGLTQAQIDTMLRILLSRAAYSWAEMPGLALAVLLGLQGGLSSQQADWPKLGDPGTPSLTGDPVGALRSFVTRVANNVSADGSPFLLPALDWLRALLGDALPGSPGEAPMGGAPLRGSGVFEDPWRVPLASTGVLPVELLVWMEPSGPSPAWVTGLGAKISAAGSVPSVLQAALSLRSFLPEMREAFAETQLEDLEAGLTTVADYLASSDGVVPLASQIPSGFTWTSGTPLTSAHHKQPSDPSAISQILGKIASWAPGPRAVLLLGPSFSDHTIWDPLLQQAEQSKPNSTNAGATFNLRIAGVPADSIDLTPVSVVADFYTADLKDDGTGDVGALRAQVGRLVARVNVLRGINPILVAHSTAGIAARDFALHNPGLVAGLITLGTPHAGSPLTPLTDTRAGEALRFVQRAIPALPAGPMGDAVGHLLQALDGYLPVPPNAPQSALPPAWPYPHGSFGGSGVPDTGGVQAFALGGILPGSLLDLIRTAFAAKATAAGNPANPAPTHLALGIAGRLDVPAPAVGEVIVDLTVRVDAFRLALAGGASGTERAITLTAKLTSPTGWLTGGPNSFVDLAAPLSGTRIRWAELGAKLTAGAGELSVAPFARLHQAAFQSPTVGQVQLSDTQAPALLGALFQAIGAPGLDPASPAGVLLEALTKLGLAVADPNGGTGLAADGFAAVQVDPVGYLGPRLLAALADPDGFLGLSGDPGGPWSLTIGNGPIQFIVSHAPDWRIGLRTDPGSPLTFGQSASLSLDVGLHVPAMTYDVTLSFNVAATTLTVTSAGTVIVEAPPWLDPLPLPPTAAAVEQAAVRAVPRIFLSSAVTAFFESVFGPVFRIGPVDKLLGAPGSTLSGSGSLGNASGGIDAAKINGLLQLFGSAIGAPDGPGLALPGGLTLSASGSDPVTIGLATTTPIGGVLGFTLDAKIDSLRHVTPDGTLTLSLPLATWGETAVEFGISPAGVTLTITPSGSPPIQLLPTFSGLGALAQGVSSTLLTQALDALADNTPSSPFKSDVLALATSLQLRSGTFSAQSDHWKQLLQGNSLAAIGDKPGLLDAVKTILTDIGIPGVLTHSAGSTLMSWTNPAGSGAVNLSFGWDAGGPAFSIGVADFKASGGPLHLHVAAGVAGNGALQADLGVGVSLQQSLGINATPQLRASYKAGGFAVDFYPLGDASSALDISLLPAPDVKAKPGALDDFVLKWIVPVAANVVVKAKGPLTQAVWPGSALTVQQLVDGSGVLAGNKTLLQMVTGLLSTLTTAGSVVIGNFHVGFASDAGGFGVRVSGFEDIPAGEIAISARFGEVMSTPPWFKGGGLTLYLFDAGLTTFTPKLSIKGLGVGFTGQNGPLINTAFLRTGRIGGYVFFDVDLKTATVTNFGAGVEIDQFGIPLGQALGGGAGGSSNPVAAGLLRSDGGKSGGDTKPVNPAVDVWASFLNNAFTIEIQNATGGIWIGIRQQFGPIYIDQIGLEITNNSKDVALLVDGSVQVAGFLVQADELGVEMPLNALASPEKWSLDLRGLAVSYHSDGVTIAGGLLKAPGAVVEYDGMLKIEIAGKGFTAVGAYSTPKEGNDTYTSLFIFVALPIVLGGPPFFFVTGLGGGAGINRRLLVPVEIPQIPKFLLVSAIDDSSFANDPMGALQKIATNIPSRRGSYWFAAGVRFDTFVLIHSVAVVYVALDRGFEIGILGVSRMALPAESVAIVSVELALKARFSSAEGILSIQAQLTDNSYLFNRSCQLTGGFAFFAWFPQGQFVLTIGGYHPAFQKPAQFPDVPRLGFRWSISSAIVVKGEAYFALTNSCVMAGGRLEASIHVGPASAWFIAYADFLISWDPFHYDIAIGIEVGVALDFDVCFIVCGHVHLELSIGADLHLIGPPLHGEVTLKVLFFHVTVPFGPDPNPKANYIQDFSVFAGKYLTAGDPNSKVVGLRVTGGLLPPDPPGAKPSPGNKSQPWQLGAEFSFVTETRMPASSWSSFVNPPSGHVPDAADVDLAAMDKTNVTSDHNITLFRVSTNAPPAPAPDAAHFLIDKIIGLFPEATWRWTDPDKMHAAARTLPAISGLTIQGVAVPVGQSQLIPIAKMVDDILQYDKPLPFATLTDQVLITLAGLGVQAETMASQLAKAPSGKMLQAAATVLAGANTFSQMRVQAGFPAPGLPPMATRSLRRQRSAPPLVAPLTTGLSMKDPGLAAPPTITRPPATGPVPLGSPRLRAVLQRRTKPLVDRAASIRTTVLRVREAVNAPRLLPPVPLTVAGARLRSLPGARSPRPTHAASAPRVLHHPETGMLLGRRHADRFVQAAAALRSPGVTLPSGTTHIWDLPPAGRWSFAITGPAAVRVVALDRASQILSDREMMPSSQPVTMPANTAMVAFTCLGVPPSVALGGIAMPSAPSGMGAISMAFAPPDSYPAAGWQVTNEFEQVGPSIVLGRGVSVKLAKTSSALHKQQRTAQNIVHLSGAALGQDGVATRLPATANVVVVLLDAQDPSAAADGDMAIAVDGATLVTPPIPVAGGHRRALLYDVKRVETGAEFFTVSVGSLTGWQVTGIAALHGTAAEWATRMHGDVPEHLVSDGPLTPDGQVIIRLLPSDIPRPIGSSAPEAAPPVQSAPTVPITTPVPSSRTTRETQ